jgi:hypothetical protein
MKYLSDIFQIDLQDLQFDGLKFSQIDEDSSFKSIKERNAYLDTLVDEGNEFSSLRYKNIFGEFQKSEIHVKLSFSFLFESLAFILIGLAFMAYVNSASVLGFALMGMSVGSLILHRYNKRKAGELYIGFLSGPDIIDYMFSEIQNSCKTK